MGVCNSNGLAGCKAPREGGSQYFAKDLIGCKVPGVTKSHGEQLFQYTSKEGFHLGRFTLISHWILGIKVKWEAFWVGLGVPIYRRSQRLMHTPMGMPNLKGLSHCTTPPPNFSLCSHDL